VENLKSIPHRCYLFEVAFVWELTKETIVLPLGCLQRGSTDRASHAGWRAGHEWGAETGFFRYTKDKHPGGNPGANVWFLFINSHTNAISKR